jgi:hypothetical protein
MPSASLPDCDQYMIEAQRCLAVSLAAWKYHSVELPERDESRLLRFCHAVPSFWSELICIESPYLFGAMYRVRWYTENRSSWEMVIANVDAWTRWYYTWKTRRVRRVHAHRFLHDLVETK